MIPIIVFVASMGHGQLPGVPNLPILRRRRNICIFLTFFFKEFYFVYFLSRYWLHRYWLHPAEAEGCHKATVFIKFFFFFILNNLVFMCLSQVFLIFAVIFVFFCKFL